MTDRRIGIDPKLTEMLAERGISREDFIKFSLLSDQRLKAMIRAVDASAGLDGDTAEIGCAAGGTSWLIATLNGGRRHWACDTFEGLVDVGPKDFRLRNGDFCKRTTMVGVVRERLSGLPNCQVVEGYFPESAPQEMCEARYSLVHIDVDTYKSIHACFAFFRPRMLPGSTLVVDDVAGRGTAGGIRAWREIMEGREGWDVVEQNNQHVVVRFEG